MRIQPVIGAVRVSFGRLRVEVRRAGVLAVVLSAATMLTGCATTKAATVVEAPPLAVPRAPERVVVPAEQEPLAATAVGLDTPLASVPRVQPPPQTQTTRPRSNRTEADAKGDAAQPSSTAAQTAGSVPDATRQLRVPSSAEAGSDYQRVLNLINKVDADLRKVDPTKLSQNDAQNFRESRRFWEQASAKLKERNVSFASVAAEKAADLAATLPTR